MNEALNYLYYIYNKFLNLVFNQMQIASGVTVGWIMISIFVFGIMIRSILNLPRGVSLRKGGSDARLRDRN